MPAKNDDSTPTGSDTPTTFSVRLRPNDYRTLTSLANLRKLSVAELAREFILDGMGRALDPIEIEQQLEAEKKRLLAAAAEMREKRETDQPHRT